MPDLPSGRSFRPPDLALAAFLVSAGSAIMGLEQNAGPVAFPKEISFVRINDAIILSIDLPDFITPPVGQMAKHGSSANDISQYFDLNLYDHGEEGEQRFMCDFRARLQTAVEDLVRFVVFWFSVKWR